MNLKLNYRNIHRDQNTFFLAIDFLMVGLIIFNLVWIVFDTLFTSEMIQQGVKWVSADFYSWYAEIIHPNFVMFDLIFVAIFLNEFFLRWMAAIHYKTYHRWFFYPFVHWYDLIGCIPVGSFRWLRLLRIISILYRLQKLKIIDLTDTYPYQFVMKYYGVLVEEVSDRVVVNVLDGIQDELKSGTPVVDRIVREILMPRRREITDWLNYRIGDIVEKTYEDRTPEVRAYVRSLVSDAIDDNPDLKQVARVPMLGGRVSDLLEDIVSDLIYHILNQIIADVKGDQSTGLMYEMTDTVFDALADQKYGLQTFSSQIVLDILDVVKEEVKVQRWKEGEEQNAQKVLV